MKFDAVVGNPPYQQVGGSGGSSDASIYQCFCEAAMSVSSFVSSLIIPARWFSGGREGLLGEFRRLMLKCQQIEKMYVYTNSRDLFPNVEIKGGVCYYLWRKNYRGQCRYSLCENGKVSIAEERNLSDFDILIRYPVLNTLVKKVFSLEGKGIHCVDSLISNDTPFGIGSNPQGSKKHPIKIYEEESAQHNVCLFYLNHGKRSIGYISRNSIVKNVSDISFVKIFLPEGYGAGEGFPHQILGVPEIAPQNSVCSQTYLYVKMDSKESAKNFVSYLKTRFFRALVLAAKVTQHAQAGVYRFVPVQDFSEEWTDEKLYKKYGITEKERTFIETMIKPMA